MDKDRFNKLKESAGATVEYLNKAIKYSKGKNWNVGDLPPEFSNTMANDKTFSIFEEYIYENPDEIETLKRLFITLIKRTNVEIANPLLDSNIINNKHKVSQYEALIDIIDNFRPDPKPQGLLCLPGYANGLPKCSMAEVALMIVYNGKRLLDPRSDHDKKTDKVAKEYGFDKPTSGLQLYGKWKTYNEPNGITGIDETKDRLIRNMIKRINKILPNLTGQALEAAKRDINALKMKQ